jgi:hypothetical protein
MFFYIWCNTYFGIETMLLILSDPILGKGRQGSSPAMASKEMGLNFFYLGNYIEGNLSSN